MTEKYEDTLNRSWDDIPEPQMLPPGSWLLRGNNVAVFPPKEEGQKTRVVFFYEAKEPMEDVQQEDLDALGDYAYSENDIVKQFWINKNKDWDAVRKHLDLHGISTKNEDGTTKSQLETFKEFKGAEIVSFLTVETYTGADGMAHTQNVPTSFARVGE